MIRDFVRFVEDFEKVGGREGEGQMDESANAVRLMTIHQAKGLEFPVVIIPDLHRELRTRESGTARCATGPVSPDPDAVGIACRD